MKKIDFKNLPKSPGVYKFKDSKGKILYVGRATVLKDRVRSYFNKDLITNRGKALVKAIEELETIDTIETDSVLEAIILEAELIRKYEPKYNSRGKDNRSFQYILITKENFPRVIVVRGRELNDLPYKVKEIFGPFPMGTVLKDAMKIIRKLFPYREKCYPKSESKNSRPCFHKQIGLCPGVCNGECDKKEYSKRIKELVLFLKGQKAKVIKSLEKDMKQLIKKEEFENAASVRDRINALKHIQDVQLIKTDYTDDMNKSFRIEAYDVAHTSGDDSVGVFVVFEDDVFKKKEYRTFKIKNKVKGSDTDALSEILNRRLEHTEWRYPNLIVLDGGKGQLSTAKKVLEKSGIMIPLVSVVKNEKHKPKDILGDKAYIETKEKEILNSNSEAHRFAVAVHRKKRKKSMFSKTNNVSYK